MYHAHFGLEKGLFGEGIAAETAVFRSPRHERLASQFKLALSSSSSTIVLRGPAGVGKTTFTSSTLRASGTRLALAWLNGTATNASELLELILVELGIAPARASRIERLQLWRQFHAEMRATDSRLFVVAERTEDLSVEVLHALDQLTAPDAAGNVGANLVLLGHPEIDAHLAAPLLDSLRQRIRLRAELEPFSEAELQDYLRHQVACARGHYEHVFAPGTVAALHRFSAGVARLANTLCETALELAASEKHRLLTAELVARTAVSLLGLSDPTPVARTPSRESTAPPSMATMPAALPAAAAPTPAAPARVVEPQTAATPATLSGAAPVAVPQVGSAPVAAVAPVAAPPPAAAAVVLATAEPSPAPGAGRSSIATPPPAAPRLTTPARAAAPAPVAPPSAPATAPAPEPPPSVTFDFDGAVTDVTDVDIMDFPVLTDAVDPHEPLLVKRATAATPAPVPASATAATPGPAPVSPPAAAVLRTPAPPRPAVAEPQAAPAKPAAAPRTPPPAAAPAVQKPAAATPSRIETAYAVPKTAPAAAAAAPKAPPPPPAAAVPSDTDLADDDLLRQTQTMRAIAVAKSIDDISSSMAETLFGDADLDLVAAALASAAAEWPDDNDAKPGSSARAEPKAAKTPPKVDDPFDIFDLGDDAPLELIDDSTLPPAGQPRKSAAR